MNRKDFMLALKKSFRFLPDLPYVKLYYRVRVGRKLVMDPPTTFNEKIQWLKFHYYVPLMSTVSDKCAVRPYVAEKIGEEYLIPEIGEWDTFDEIDFDKLPDQFVLKCNHDSGGLVICQDKSTFDREKARKKIEKCLKTNFFYVGRERQYLYIKPRILCEQYIDDHGKPPEDYKIYCFNGEPDCVMVVVDRYTDPCFYHFDLDWNFLPYCTLYPVDKALKIPKPEHFDKMLEIARILSKDFVFARIDLYNEDGRIYFGEITLSPNSGFDSEFTLEADQILGSKLDLSGVTPNL